MHKGHFADGSYDKELFRRFDIVMSGHFHHKSDDGQIYYLGTPYEIYWNDYEDPRGFHIFDTETRELERIVNPYRIFEKVYYDEQITLQQITLVNKKDMSKLKDMYVKVIVVNKKDLYQFDKFKNTMIH